MLLRTLVVTGVALAPAGASALCIHNGKLDAKTTIAQEFAESRWVVRAHVVSGDYHWSGEGDSWTLYRLKPVHIFKGKLPSRFNFFTERNSGGFYMDGDGGLPDLDHDYLLFLIRVPYPPGRPPAAHAALWINYECGQSKIWSQVSKDDLRQLRSLSSRR